MDIKVGKQAIAEASKKLSNWGRWGKDDQVGTLNHVTPEDIVKAMFGRLTCAGKGAQTDNTKGSAKTWGAGTSRHRIASRCGHPACRLPI